MSVKVRLPAALLSSSWGPPTLCVRHGEPAFGNKFVKFMSPQPLWTYILLPLGVIPFLLVTVMVRKWVEVKAWPFCVRCRHERKRNILFSVGLLVGGIFVPTPVAGLLGGRGDTLFAIILLGLLVSVAGIVLAVRWPWVWYAGGRVVEGDQMVEFPKAHERFAAQVAIAQQTAAEHWAVARP